MSNNKLKHSEKGSNVPESLQEPSTDEVEISMRGTASKPKKERFKTHIEEKPFFSYCEPCFQEIKPAYAVKICLSCSRRVCDECTERHSCVFNLGSKEEEYEVQTVEGIECDPCKERGDMKLGIKICEECEEIICKNCADFHRSFKSTRSHNVMEIVIESIKCNACLEHGLCNKEAERSCNFCNMDLCVTCSQAHVTDTTKPHKLDSIPHRQERMASKIKTLKHSLKMEKKRQETFRTKDMLQGDQPGKPKAVETLFESVSLIWDKPKNLFDDHSYEVRYKIVSNEGRSKWKIYDIQTEDSCIRVDGLKAETQYVFQVKMVADEHEGRYSEPSEVINTEKSAASSLIDCTRPTENACKSPVIRQLIPKQRSVHQNPKAKTRKIIFHGNKTPRTEKTIMLVGDKGSEKGKLIDGMINYIYGVTWEDPYRFTVQDLDETEAEHQADSKTDWITCYTIPLMTGSRINFTLNIIDTPEFGETTEGDQEKVNQIKELLTGRGSSQDINQLDSICFIIKAQAEQLTSPQLYTFEAILSFLGVDVKENICFLITSADSKSPAVLSALKSWYRPNELYFTFNNSGLFAENSDTEHLSISAMFWKMCVNSLRLFFEKLDVLISNDLNKTRQVRTQRRKINATKIKLNRLLNDYSQKTESLKQERKMLEYHERIMRENEKFEYEITDTSNEQLPLGLEQEKKLLENHARVIGGNDNFEYEDTKTSHEHLLLELKQKGNLPRIHERVMGENESLEYENTATKIEQPLFGFENCVISCKYCHSTCHRNCSKSDDRQINGNWDSSGNCRKCKCHQTSHEQTTYEYTDKMVQKVVKKTSFEKFEKYTDAKAATLVQSLLVENIVRETEELDETVVSFLRQLKNDIEILDQIALRPKFSDTQLLIEMMRRSEKLGIQPGNLLQNNFCGQVAWYTFKAFDMFNSLFKWR